MRSIELWGALAPLRISRFRVWSFGPSRNDALKFANEKPRPAGEYRTRLSSPDSRKSANASSGALRSGACGLVYHLNDTAAARLDQNGRAVHYGGTEWRAGQTVRHIGVSHAGCGQHGADHDAVWNSESRHALAHHIFPESRPLFGDDAAILLDDDGVAADNADRVLRLCRDRHTQRAGDRCRSKKHFLHGLTPSRLEALSAGQCLARGIVPGASGR